MPRNTSYKIGIDIGHTYLKVAFYDKNFNAGNDIDKIDLYSFEFGYNITKNIINLGRGNSTPVYVRIGDCNYQRTETSVKTLKHNLYKEEYNIYIPQINRYMDSVEMLKWEFFWIKNKIFSDRSADINELLDAMITVPVFFTDFQKNNIKRAAEAAGLYVLDIISEPFAGLFSQSNLIENIGDQERTNVFICDIGSGTTDMTLLEINTKASPYEITTLFSEGLAVGGTDIDEILCGQLLEERDFQHLEDCVEREMRSFLKNRMLSEEDRNPESYTYKLNKLNRRNKVNDRLFNDIVSFKKTICEYTNMRITPDEPHFFASASLNREEENYNSLSYSQLENLLRESPMTELIKNKIKEMLEYSMVPSENIDKIILIGGSSQIIYFRKLMAEIFEIPDDQVSNKIISGSTYDSVYGSVAMGSLKYYFLRETNKISVSAEEPMPYELGIINEDGVYSCVRSSSIVLGLGSRSFNVTPIDCGSFYKVKIYRQALDTTADNGAQTKKAVYAGYFRLEKEPTFNKCLMSIMIDNDGKIKGIFTALNDPNGNTTSVELCQ